MEMIIAAVWAAFVAGLPWLCIFMGLDWLRNTKWNVQQESLEAQFQNERDFE